MYSPSQQSLQSFVAALNNFWSLFNIVFDVTILEQDLSGYKETRTSGQKYSYSDNTYKVSYLEQDINGTHIPGTTVDGIMSTYSFIDHFNIFLVHDIAGLDFDGVRKSTGDYSMPIYSINPALHMIKNKQFGLVCSMWSIKEFEGESLYSDQVLSHAYTLPSQTTDVYRGMGHCLGLFNSPTAPSSSSGLIFDSLLSTSCPSNNCILSGGSSGGGECVSDNNKITLAEGLDSTATFQASCMIDSPLLVLDNFMGFYPSDNITATMEQIRRVRSQFDCTYTYESATFIWTFLSIYTIPQNVVIEPVVFDIDCEEFGNILSTNDIQYHINSFQSQVDFSSTNFTEEEITLQGQILYLQNLLGITNI